MKFILGKKLDMTQVWKGDAVIPVTRVQAGPCLVTQVKNSDKDGYQAVQVGYGAKKEKNMTKPVKGHLKKAGKLAGQKEKTDLRYVREFRLDKNGRSEKAEVKMGDIIDVTTFKVGDVIKVTGTSKGKGFQGVVKRHGFSGQKATHGNKDQLRMPGSIGATEPAHVFKGMRMPGHMGNAKSTTTNLEVIQIDEENNILYIRGSVPGARNSLVMVQGPGELKVAVPEVKAEPVVEPAVEVVKDEDVKPVEKVKTESETVNAEVKAEPAAEEAKTVDVKPAEEVKAENKTEEKAK
jgi:large subunit ribosomal protein L3